MIKKINKNLTEIEKKSYNEYSFWYAVKIISNPSKSNKNKAFQAVRKNGFSIVKLYDYHIHGLKK